MTDNDDDDDDEVGYGKPPKKNRFKPGQSGNPRGRPRNTRSLRAELMKALGTTVTITEDGKTRRVTKREAIACRLVNKAMLGDTRSIITLEQLAHEEEQAKIAKGNQVVSFTLKLGEKPLPGYSPEDDYIGPYPSISTKQDDSETPNEPDETYQQNCRLRCAPSAVFAGSTFMSFLSLIYCQPPHSTRLLGRAERHHVGGRIEPL